MSLFTTGKNILLLALNTVYQWHCDNLLFCGNLLLSSAINIPAYCLNLEKIYSTMDVPISYIISIFFNVQFTPCE